MECSQIRAILFESADTEIPEELREDVEAHLAVCRPCASQFEALADQSRALRNLPAVDAPGDFLEKVRSRVEKPSALSRLEQWLSVVFAGKRFFRLAGAAAAAALVIVTVQVALKDGSMQKSLHTPAPSSVGSPSSIGSPPSVEAPKASLAPAPRPSPGVESQVVALTLRLPGASPGVRTRGGAFGPGGFAASSPGPAAMGAPVERRLQSDASKEGAGRQAATEGNHRAEAKKMPAPLEGSSPPEAQEISFEVIRLINGANGKVLSAAAAGDENQPGTLLAEMPAANYPSFLDQLRQLGQVESNDDKKFSPAPDAKVRVEVSFATR